MPQSPALAPVRQIIRGYGEAWAREAVRSLPRVAPGDGHPEVLLVDPFAGVDYPSPVPRPGSTGAAETLLRERERVRVALVEEDPAKVAWLRGRLDEILPGEPVSVDHDAPSAGLTLREGAPSLLDGLGAARDAALHVLLTLDPPSAGLAPLEALRGWIAHRGTDLLLRLPMTDLRRLAGHRGSAIADLPPRLKRTVEGLSTFLDDRRHRWTYAWSAALRDNPEAAERAFVDAYVERVHAAAGAPIVRVLDVPGEAGEERLLLCTHLPASALLLNHVVHELREQGALPCPDVPGALVRYRPRSELALFGAEGRPGGAPERERVVDRTRLAHSIAEIFAGRSVDYDEVLRSQAGTDLFAGEVRRALLDLRRDGRALFRSLGPDSPVAFPRAGARRPRPLPATKRRAGAGEELELDL